MPDIFNPTLETHQTAGSHYGFSAENLQNLDATEYTLVTIAVDVSLSVDKYRQDMESCLKTILKACRLSSRADFLMARLLTFNTRINEVHGFTMLQRLNEGDYTGVIRASGSTALYDATFNAIEATATYAEQLLQKDYPTNAIVVILTDGEENASAIQDPQLIADQVKAIVHGETLESLRTILIGVGANSSSTGSLNTYLDNFKTKAGFDQYVPVGTSASDFAKTAEFIKNSISSQSVSLGSGGPSQLITY